MKPFQIKKLAAATSAALLGLAFATGAAANVSLTVDGFGDAGILPYYTVNDGWQTMYRIFNNSPDAVAVKVRFREAANSREVLDFVVWLSPYDAWSFWTDPNASGQGAAVPGIRTRDTSCTTPGPELGLPSDTFGWVNNDRSTGVRYAEFKTRAITGQYADGTPIDASDRIKEGHVEIIGMAAFPVGTQVFGSVIHSTEDVNQVVSPSCAGLADFNFGRPWNQIAPRAEQAIDVGNVLAMNAYLMRLGTGQGGGYEPVVLANFSTNRADPTAPQRMLWELVSDAQKPDLDSGDTASWVPDVDEQAIWEDDWADMIPRLTARLPWAGPAAPLPQWEASLAQVVGGIDAVSATMTRSAVVNEWARRDTPGEALQSLTTQWVLTFPTKHYYVDTFCDPIATRAPDNLDNIYPTLAPPGPCQFGQFGNLAVYAPFSSPYRGTSPERFRMLMWNTEEELRFFTSPVPNEIPDLEWQTNVIEFGDQADPVNGVNLGLASNFAVTVPESELPPNPRRAEVGFPKADVGWAILEFWSPNAFDPGLVGDTNIYYGLPVTGFSFVLYQSDPGNADGNASMIVPHKYERDIFAD